MGTGDRLGELVDAATGMAGGEAMPGSLRKKTTGGRGIGRSRQHEKWKGHQLLQEEQQQFEFPKVERNGKLVPLKFPAWSTGWGQESGATAGAAYLGKLVLKVQVAVAVAAGKGPAFELLAYLGRTTLPMGVATTGDGNCGFNAVSQYQEMVAGGGYRIPGSSSSSSEQLRRWEHRHAQLRRDMCDMVESNKEVQGLMDRIGKCTDDAQLSPAGSGVAIEELKRREPHLSMPCAYARVMRDPVSPSTGKSYCLTASWSCCIPVVA
jgi:hypothetical protein